MKIVFLISSLLISVVADQFDLGRPFSMLRRTQSNRGRRQSKQPCLVVFAEKEYADHHHEDQPLECELHENDKTDSRTIKMVKVTNLTRKWANRNNVKSGETSIYAENSFIDDFSNELIIPTNTTIKLGRDNGGYSGSNRKSGLGSLDPSDLFWNRNLQTASVIKRVLVLRINASDKQTTATESKLADEIFGAAGDPLNLKSQFNQCSYGQLQFEATTSNSVIGSDGVYTVSMPTTVVTGQDDNPIAWAAVNKAEADLGVSLLSIANHVIVCMPPGTTGGWIAYAYINHWLSVYNDDWCTYPSGLMHELGHNLNLDHSGEGTAEYDDQSGMMGYSYGSDDTPVMCFNGAKTWQLGWFANYHVDLSVASGFSWTGNLVGFTDRASAGATDKMIIRIQSTSSSTDTYIHFNRAIGFNSQTQEGVNQVLVATRSAGSGFAPSLLVAKLGSGGVYTIPNFNGSTSSLKLTVTSLITTTTPARANVSIQLILPTASPTRNPTGSPTLAPTGQPTRAPTRQPTGSPTFSPTGQPTSSAPTTQVPAVPTESPTRPPTTGMPTDPPTFSTAAPTESPSLSPALAAPTNSPTSPPTATPTSEPTDLPSPTDAPTRAPTTTSPTRKPTTSRPTRKPTTMRPTRNRNN